MTVLIFLQILSMLGLCSLMSISVLLKTTRHAWQREIDERAANKILQNIEVTFAPDCMIPITSAAMLAKNPIIWWQQNACIGEQGSLRYFYTIEPLGPDPCGIISKSTNNQPLIADYYRITLLTLAQKSKIEKIIFQSTIVKPLATTALCSVKTHKVFPGRQMWREVAY